MRLFPLSLIALMLAGCATPAEELLPIPAAVRGASRIEAVEIVVRASAAASIAALDESEATGAAARQPFRPMLAAAVQRVAREWGLTAGRPLKLVVEVDEVAVPGLAAAALGRRDRLAGSVFVTDAASGAPLGQLYVDVVNSNAGVVGIALRGGNVREALAEEFALHVARALSGRRHRP